MKKKNGNKNIKLTIKNVRCFSSEQHFNIKPLTFLVGENSTGKTTVMGCFNIIGNLINNRYRDPNVLDFNRDPYLMGSFEDIVTKKSKTNSHKNGHKETFEISCDLEESNCKYNIHFVEKENGAEPIIKKAIIDFKDISFSFDNKTSILDIKEKIDNKKNIQLSLKEIDNKTLKLDTKEKIDNKKNIPIHFKDFGNSMVYDFIKNPYNLITPFFLLKTFFKDEKTSQNNKNNKKQKEIMKNIQRIFKDSNHGNELKNIFSENIVSLSPIRSKPKRTYDPMRETPDPEGMEIPVTLRKLSDIEKDWKNIHKKLVQFGESSGLFSDVTVKKYGKSISEPFQLQFEIGGFQSNIMDAGYGISQILPLLVRLFYPRKENSNTNRFLLQQPEIHLHPKARAEFTSLLIENIKNNNSFLIETHSDHMLDRARIEIRKKKIPPDEVSLIYLEPTKQGVKSHNMSFDEEGNLIGAPQGYRAFFNKETDRFLGFED